MLKKKMEIQFRSFDEAEIRFLIDGKRITNSIKDSVRSELSETHLHCRARPKDNIPLIDGRKFQCNNIAIARHVIPVLLL